jgi:hypothetical protein
VEPNRANVLSVDVLEAVAVAMVRCQEDLAAALLEADSEIERTMVWVERDRLPYWKKRLQRIDLDMQEARSALFRKENHRVTKDSKPSVVDERKALAKAQAAHEEAERRGRASHRWSQELPRQHAEFRRGVNALAAMVDRELPQAIAALRRMTIALERYRRDQPIDLRSLLPERQPDDAAGSMRRGGETPGTGSGSA